MADIDGRVKRLRDMAASQDGGEMLAIWNSLPSGAAVDHSLSKRSVSADNVFAGAIPKGDDKHRKLTQQLLVLDASLREEKVKSEKLSQELRQTKIALAKEKQAKELADKEKARLARDLVAGKEALAAFAKRARLDREEAVASATAVAAKGSQIQV
jgi:hypothetical protein